MGEQETKQVPSALLQKFRLKINIPVYVGIAGVLVALGLLQPKAKSYIWNQTISQKPTRFPTFLYIYCLFEVKDVGSKSSWSSPNAMPVFLSF